MTTYTFDQYWHGQSAAKLAQSEDGAQYLHGAFMALAGDNGLGLGEGAEGFIDGTMASNEGIATAIKTYDGKFKKGIAAQKVSDLAGHYQPILEGLDDAQKAKILSEFTKHGDKTLGQINEEIARAKYVKADPTGTFHSDQARADADATLGRYKSLGDTLKKLDQYKTESLRPEAVNFTRRRELKNLADKL